MKKFHLLDSIAKKHFGESNGNILRFPSQVMIMFRLKIEKSRHEKQCRAMGYFKFTKRLSSREDLTPN